MIFRNRLPREWTIKAWRYQQNKINQNQCERAEREREKNEPLRISRAAERNRDFVRNHAKSFKLYSKCFALIIFIKCPSMNIKRLCVRCVMPHSNKKIVIYFIRPEARNENSKFRAKRSVIEAKPAGRRSTVSNQ